MATPTLAALPAASARTSSITPSKRTHLVSNLALKEQFALCIEHAELVLLPTPVDAHKHLKLLFHPALLLPASFSAWFAPSLRSSLYWHSRAAHQCKQRWRNFPLELYDGALAGAQVLSRLSQRRGGRVGTPGKPNPSGRVRNATARSKLRLILIIVRNGTGVGGEAGVAVCGAEFAGEGTRSGD